MLAVAPSKIEDKNEHNRKESMNTLIKTCTAAVLMTVSTLAMAAHGPKRKLEKTRVDLSIADFALAHYVAVTTEGESTGLEQLFAEDFNQKIQTANVQTYGRKAVIKLFEKQKGEMLNCKVHTKIIEKSPDYMVAKITLKFEHFRMHDLVTFVYDDGEWKVAKSIHSYE